MVILKYNDLIDSNTLTSKVFAKQQREIKWLEVKLERMKAFDAALTNYLKTHGEMNYDLYNEAYIMFDHSNKTVPEIFEEIRKRD